MDPTASSDLAEEIEGLDTAISGFTTNALDNAVEVSADLKRRESRRNPLFSSPFVKDGFPGSSIELNRAEDNRFNQFVVSILTDLLVNDENSGHINPEKRKFLQSSVHFAVDMIAKRVSPAIKRLLTRPEWNLSDLVALAIPREKVPRNIRGVCALLCLDTVYLGSTMNIHDRIFGRRGHQDQIDLALNREPRLAPA